MNRRVQTLVHDVAPGVAMAAFLVVVSPLAAPEQPGERALDAPAFVMLAAAGLVLIGRRSQPLPAYVASLGITVAYFAFDYPGGPIFVAAFAGLLGVVAAHSRRVWLPAAVLGAALLTVTNGLADGWSPSLIGAGLVWLAGAFVFAEAVRSRREHVAEVEDRARWAERTREEEALRRVAEERLRIAREVHDVVGHSLSTISLHAGVAERGLDSRPEKARESVLAIRELSKEALGELRAVLGLLRSDHAPEARAPTPGLDGVPDLVDSMRDAGLAVALEWERNGAVIADVVGAASYRIVQEALTNVLRHAGADAHARVRLACPPGAVEVEIVDDGPGAEGRAPPNGSGLAGMRERAAALGGSFEAGPSSGGGFRVWARLPSAAR